MANRRGVQNWKKISPNLKSRRGLKVVNYVDGIVSVVKSEHRNIG